MSEASRTRLCFTVAREDAANGNGSTATKRFTLELGAETPIPIGRAPANDVVVDSRGVSQYHAELRVLRQDGDSASLHVRDLSMNGTGVKRPGGVPVHLDKRADEHVPDGSVLLVPMLLKVSQQTSDRAWLKVEYLTEAEAAASSIPAANGKSHKSRKTAAVSQVAREENGSDASNNGENASNGNSGEDTEKARMKFVELLLKTKEVAAGTTYEEAKKLLSNSADWDAVEENTRKECFDIFVEHLGSHTGSKKKDKKKGKEKKDKSKKSKRDDSAGAASDSKEKKDKSKKSKRDDSVGAASDSKEKKDKSKKSKRDDSVGATAQAASRDERRQRRDRRGDRSNDASPEAKRRRRGERRGSR